MSFPQTTPIEALRNGQQIWRLFTPLDSSGDIYESEASARSLVIGPDSDIAQVQATYYDVQNPNLANTVSVSVNKPYVGRLDALVSATYQSGDRARLLLSPLDLVPPPNFRPPGAGADVVEVVVPKIDVLAYLNEVPTYIPPRTNGNWLFETLPAFVSMNPQWFLVPFYGRRFAEITAKSLGIFMQPAVTLTVYGLNFSNILSFVLADDGYQLEQLVLLNFAAPGLGAGITHSTSIVNRSFDYLAIKIDGGGAFPDPASFPVHIVTSDEI